MKKMFLPFRLISTIFFIRFVDLEKDTVVLPQDMKNDKIFDDSQQAVQAAVIWSKPRHPIWEFILKRIGRGDLLPYVNRIKCAKRRQLYEERLSSIFAPKHDVRTMLLRHGKKPRAT